MKAYYIREIDDDVWARAKARAKAEGRNIRGVFHMLLLDYAKPAIITCLQCGWTGVQDSQRQCPVCSSTFTERTADAVIS